MNRQDLDEQLLFAYKAGYEDRQNGRDYDFHSHSYFLLDNFEIRACENCKHLMDNDYLNLVCMNDDSYVYRISEADVKRFGCTEFKRKE